MSRVLNHFFSFFFRTLGVRCHLAYINQVYIYRRRKAPPGQVASRFSKFLADRQGYRLYFACAKSPPPSMALDCQHFSRSALRAEATQEHRYFFVPLLLSDYTAKSRANTFLSTSRSKSIAKRHSISRVSQCRKIYEVWERAIFWGVFYNAYRQEVQSFGDSFYSQTTPSALLRH